MAGLRKIDRVGGGLSRSQAMNLISQQSKPQPDIRRILNDIIEGFIGGTTNHTMYVWPLEGTWSFERLVFKSTPPPSNVWPKVTNIKVTNSTANVAGTIQFEIDTPPGIPLGTEVYVVFSDTKGNRLFSLYQVK